MPQSSEGVPHQESERSDVVVVGGGNAGLCAALSARESGARVTVLERAPFEARGGNSAFTAGIMRVVFSGVDDIEDLVELTDWDRGNSDFGSYSRDDFLHDLARVTEFRCDPDLASILVDESLPTLRWMREKGVGFGLSYRRQAFEHQGRFKFWGGLAVETTGGGQGLVDALTEAAGGMGIEILYGARAERLAHTGGRVSGVEVRFGDELREISADAVILAAGGFQANTEWRTRYLGPGWDLAKVRGTRYNTGDGIAMALDVGAKPYGNWSGCHAVAWDRNAPDVGDLRVGDGFQKHSYPFSVMVNARGERFVDEGADFRNFTYAKYGQRILEQPGQVAWQVFDQKVAHLLRDEYHIREATRVRADSIEELAGRMEGIDAARFIATVAEYNAAVDQSIPFDPNVKDGRGTRGLPLPKSNWANMLDEPPFEAYQVTCGITFTFGGLHIDERARVLDVEDNSIPGLYACGELVGGLFYFNYPGGSGLTAGSVFGRIAGANAAVDAPVPVAEPSAV